MPLLWDSAKVSTYEKIKEGDFASDLRPYRVTCKHPKWITTHLRPKEYTAAIWSLVIEIYVKTVVEFVNFYVEYSQIIASIRE